MFFCAIAIAAAPAVLFAQAGVGPTPNRTDIVVVTLLKATDEAGHLAGTVVNNSNFTVNASYTWSRLNGKNWVPFKQGTVKIPQKKTITLTEIYSRGAQEAHVRLEVRSDNPKTYSGRDLKMHAKRTYVLRYKTQGWVQCAYQFQKTTSELLGTQVDKHLAECRKYGFTTKSKRDKTTVVFGTDSYRTYGYARLDNFVEKTYETKEEREKFERFILKLVPSYTNDGPGLNVQLSER